MTAAQACTFVEPAGSRDVDEDSEGVRNPIMSEVRAAVMDVMGKYELNQDAVYALLEIAHQEYDWCLKASSGKCRSRKQELERARQAAKRVVAQHIARQPNLARRARSSKARNVGVTSSEQSLSEYELARKETIARNESVLFELGLIQRMSVNS